MKRAIRTFKETVEIRSSWINRLRANRYLPVALLVSAFLAAACIHVWQRVKVLQLVKEVEQLSTENAQLVNEAKKTHAQITRLQMSARIEQYGTDTLGLQTVSADRFFTLVRKEAQEGRADDMAIVLAAMKRVAQYIPVVSENKVQANPLQSIEVDSSAFRENNK